MKNPIPPSAREKRIGAERMKLPFDKRKQGGGWAAWVFRHRIGLMVTTVIYLSAAILFLTYKIVILPVPAATIMMEFEPEEQLMEQPKVEDAKQIEQLNYDAGARVQNRASDQNAKLDAALRDDRHSEASDIYKEAERVTEQMKAGSDAFARSIQDIENSGRRPSDTKPSKAGSKGGTAESSRFRGNVAVSYDLPGRTDVYLHHPTYQCQGGGQVVVAVTVNRNGKVVSASVDKASSTDDPCILDMAVKASLASSFNTSASAPDRQRGTITYTFVPQ